MYEAPLSVMVVDGIHVVPQRRGGWEVRSADSAVALSEHATETDAERAAVAAADVLHAGRVVVHDRYTRVRIVWADGRPAARPPA